MRVCPPSTSPPTCRSQPSNRLARNASGPSRHPAAETTRPDLAALLSYARTGDVLAVWRLDRLGRSLPHLLAVAAELDTAGVELRSLTEAIDTTTAGGRPTLPPATIDAIRTLDQTGTPRTNIARALGISRSSVYRSL